MKTAKLRCIGRVQGVFFRASTRDKAVELGLRGYVRNESNGDVSVMAQGTSKNVEKLIEWCRQGPPMAKVDKVLVSWEEITEEFDRFEVRY